MVEIAVVVIEAVVIFALVSVGFVIVEEVETAIVVSAGWVIVVSVGIVFVAVEIVAAEVFELMMVAQKAVAAVEFVAAVESVKNFAGWYVAVKNVVGEDVVV